MKRLVTSFVFFFSLSGHLVAQTDNVVSISGTVVDDITNKPIEFASVGVRGKSRGTITNAVGKFSLSITGASLNDTLQFSMVGYHQVMIPIRSVSGDVIINMKEAPMLLNEIVISDKAINAERIFKSIKENLEKNYPVHEYAVECFYREIKKENYTYKSLLEAALVIKDKGYDQQRSPEVAFVREIRGSSKYVNKYSSFWQNDNLWRETMGVNAVRHPSNKPNVFGRDQYTLEGTSTLNDKVVYVLKSDASLKPWQRTIYVDVDNYTIYRSEEAIIDPTISYKESDSVSMRVIRGKSTFDFKNYKGRWYASHIRFEAENEYFNPKTNESLQTFTIINDLMVNDIYENAKVATDNLPRLEERALEQQLTRYNESFWKNYNAVLQTPLEVEVMKDLMKDGELKFLEAAKSSKKIK